MRSALAAIALVAILGCHHEKAAPVAPPANHVEAPKPIANEDVLAYLPVDAEIVVGFDFAVLRKSALYQTFEKQVLDKFARQLAEAQRCGIDPARTLQSVSIGGSLGSSGQDFDGVVVFRGVDPALVMPCIAKQAQTKGTAKVDVGQDMVVVSDSSANDTFAAAAGGPATLVFHIGKTATRETLTKIVASGAPLRSSPTCVGLFDRREANAAVWGMIIGNAAFMAALKQSGITAKLMDGTLRVTDQLTAALRMTMPSPAEADSLVALAQGMLPQARKMLERIDVRADGAVVHFDVVATEPQLRAIAGMLGAFGP
jgi:hypothetical protein